jgi:hypothetical protein
MLGLHLAAAVRTLMRYERHGLTVLGECPHLDTDHFFSVKALSNTTALHHSFGYLSSVRDLTGARATVKMQSLSVNPLSSPLTP